MAGAGDLDLVAVGSCGIPAFEIGVDGSVCSCYQHPAWFAPPKDGRLHEGRPQAVNPQFRAREWHESTIPDESLSASLFTRRLHFAAIHHDYYYGL